MANDLVDPNDLSHLPGAPFTIEEVDGAVVDVRAAAEWHIAPQRTETVALDVAYGETTLRLPTRQLVSVTEIRDVDGPTVIDPTRYRVSTKLARVKRKSGTWPDGYERVEVDMTHGYAATPLDLLAVVAEAANMARRDQSIRSVQIDDFQQMFGTGSAPSGPLSAVQTLARYSLSGDPLYGLGIA